MEQEKVAGIIGGMGPEATVDFMQRIIRLTPASDDCDHIRCLVDNNPKIPSRIKAIIEGNGESPAPCMAEMAKRLEKWGADFLVIPCNTAHYYYEPVQKAVSIPVVNLIDLVCAHIKRNYPDESQIGILASPSVKITGLYTKRLAETGAVDIWPDRAFQEKLLNTIREIKKGNSGEKIRSEYREVCLNLVDKGAGVTIVACTELGVLHPDVPVETVDAAEVLALETVRMAKS
ncbi:MAG: amino acid racemase [Desulfobacteraceae bacterium]